MRCPKCSKLIPGADPFCAYCGSRIPSTRNALGNPWLLGAGLLVMLLLGGGVAVVLAVALSVSVSTFPTQTAIAFAPIEEHTPTALAPATRTPQVVAFPVAPSPVPTSYQSLGPSRSGEPADVSFTATAGPGAPRPSTTRLPSRTPLPVATPFVVFITATPPPTSTATPTQTATATPTAWFGFMSLRWEPSSPHWGDDVVFYATFNNTFSDQRYLSWLVEVCRPDCPNWRVLMYQTRRKEDLVPPGGFFEVGSAPPWPLRGQGGTQTYPVRFVHVSPDDSRIGENIYYLTVTPR